MEDQNDYEAFFNSCNAPQESASWTDDLQAIVESEGQNSREIFSIVHETKASGSRSLIQVQFKRFKV